MIRYRAPMDVIEPATEFTIAAVSLFKLIIMVLSWYMAAYPMMNQINPNMNAKINVITDTIKETATTGNDLTSLIIVFASFTSSISFTSFNDNKMYVDYDINNYII